MVGSHVSGSGIEGEGILTLVVVDSVGCTIGAVQGWPWMVVFASVVFNPRWE